MNAGADQGYAAAPAGNDTQDFYQEVDDIRSGIDNANANIARIEQLHGRSLNDIDEAAQQQTQRQLEQAVAETSALNKDLVMRIRVLKGKAVNDPSMAPQINVLDRNCKEMLRKYQLVEKTFVDRTRDQMARQYRIVKPDASDEEVQAACDDAAGTQIFSQALLNGNRRGEARSALREVQARHNEILRIERTIMELAELFEQMEQMVMEQHVMVEAIAERAEAVHRDVVKADEELGQAVDKARSARRKKWWCLLIISEFPQVFLTSVLLFMIIYFLFFLCTA
ncbi:t-SNARE [Pyronema domesticum]|nr:t-SNARE [Pyronema domesticum]